MLSSHVSGSRRNDGMCTYGFLVSCKKGEGEGSWKGGHTGCRCGTGIKEGWRRKDE